MGYRVGTAKIDVTPPLTVPYLGYNPRHAYFHGIHDPLFARAVVIECDGKRVAIVSVDVLALSRNLLGPDEDFVWKVRERIFNLTGIEHDHILLAATHAHSTPETSNIESLADNAEALQWLPVFADQLASVVAMASQNLEPVEIKFGCEDVLGVSGNRRMIGEDGRLYSTASKPEGVSIVDHGHVDRELGALVAVRSDGSVKACIINFACHPVSVQVQPLISADFPGVACDIVERYHPQSVCLFLQGASGDINPLNDTSGFFDVKRYGTIVGASALKIIGRLTDEKEPGIDVRLEVASEQMTLPGRQLPSREEANSRDILRLIELGSDPITTQAMVMRIGSVAIAAVPGELFAELGTEIKEKSPATHTLVATLANDHIGYLATPKDWEIGGYEVSLGPWCLAGEEGGPQCVDHHLRLLNQLWKDR